MSNSNGGEPAVENLIDLHPHRNQAQQRSTPSPRPGSAAATDQDYHQPPLDAIVLIDEHTATSTTEEISGAVIPDLDVVSSAQPQHQDNSIAQVYHDNQETGDEHDHDDAGEAFHDSYEDFDAPYQVTSLDGYLPDVACISVQNPQQRQGNANSRFSQTHPPVSTPSDHRENQPLLKKKRRAARRGQTGDLSMEGDTISIVNIFPEDADFQSIIQEVDFGISNGHLPRRISQGSSGSYFVYNSDGTVSKAVTAPFWIFEDLKWSAWP